MRNFLKFLYEIDPRLAFVTLMGDANRDSRGVLPNSNPDWCPTFVESAWPYHPDRGDSRDESLVPFARDDWFVSLDDPVVRSNNFDLDLPDLSIGRMPANSPAEANRSRGSFAMPRATTSSKPRLTPRRMMLGRGGGANMCALHTCRMSAASNGAPPVSDSYSRHASASYRRVSVKRK